MGRSHGNSPHFSGTEGVGSGYEHLPSDFLGRTKRVEGTSHEVGKRPVVLANPSAVTIAFRELQERAKVLEAERDLARDETKEMEEKIAELSGGREDRYAARNASRLKATETLFHVREEGNKVRVQMGEMDAKLVYLDNDYRAIHMNLASDRGTFSVVEDDCVELRGKLLELTSKKDILDAEVNRMRGSNEEKQTRLSKLPSKHQTQAARLKASVKKTEEQIKILVHQKEQQYIQMETVKKYLDMLLDVNDEICDTVAARELARTRTLRLSGRVNLPPNSPDRDLNINPPHPPSRMSSRKVVNGRSDLADGLAASLKNGSSCNSPTSATRAIASLIQRAQDIALSKDDYVKSDFAAAGAYVDNSLPDSLAYDNDDEVDDDGSFYWVESPSRKVTMNSNGKKKKKNSNNPAGAGGRGAVPLNEVMKVINADAVRHALRSQKEAASRDARDLLEVTSGLGIGFQGGEGQATGAGTAKTNKRRSGSTSATRKEDVKKGNNFYKQSIDSLSFGYDAVVRGADAYSVGAARKAASRPAAAPILRLSGRPSSSSSGTGTGTARTKTVARKSTRPWSGGGGGDVSSRRKFWCPAGVADVSENKLINRDKVAAAKKRNWVEVPLNHFNKLHGQ
jgi:hypothetical protein